MTQVNSTIYHTQYDDLISCKDNIFSRRFMEFHRKCGEFYLIILRSNSVANDKYYFFKNIYFSMEGDRIKGRKNEYPIPASFTNGVSKESVKLLEPLIFFRNSTLYPEWDYKDLGYVSPDEDDTSVCSSTSVLDSLIHDVYHNNLFFITGEKESSKIFKNHLKKITVFVFKPDLIEQFRYENFLTCLLTQNILCSDIANLIDVLGKDVKNSLYDFGYLDTYFYEYYSRGDIHPYRKIVSEKLEYHVDTVNLLKSACRILDEFGNDEEENKSKTVTKEKYHKPNAISLTLNLSKHPDMQYATADIFKFSQSMSYHEMNENTMSGLIATTDKMNRQFKDKFSLTLRDILKNHTASLFKTVDTVDADKTVHYL